MEQNINITVVENEPASKDDDSSQNSTEQIFSPVPTPFPASTFATQSQFNFTNAQNLFLSVQKNPRK